VKFEGKYFKGLAFCAVRFVSSITGQPRVWNDGNIRRVIMRQVMDNILPKNNVVNPPTMELFDVPLCNSIVF
jgi:hypothetical protein